MSMSDVRQEEALCGLIAEYRGVFDEQAGEQGKLSSGQWDEIEERVRKHCGWTEEGSAHVVCLARDYGAFVLRNALALAVALEVEDGMLGL